MPNTVLTHTYYVLRFKIRKIPILNTFTFMCDYKVTAHFFVTNLENILDLYSDKYRSTWLCEL